MVVVDLPHIPYVLRAAALAGACAALALAGCGAEPGTGAQIPSSYNDASGEAADALKSDGAGQDGASGGDTVGDTVSDAASGVDSGGADASGAADQLGADAGAGDDADGTQAFPDGFFDPPDSGGDDDAGGQSDALVPPGPVGELYAHTATQLYRLDIASNEMVLVGDWAFDKKEGKVTDIALDRYGVLYAISHDDLFVCDRLTAKCAWKLALPTSFNGLTFVPEGILDPTTEALVGMGDDGSWNHIDFKSGVVKIKKIGSYGGGWLSSGDAFSVFSIGTFATLKGKGNSDSLARIDPKTGKIEKLIGETGAVGLFGLAWWKGVFYGFSKTGEVYTLDHKSGKATKVTTMKLPKGVSWWGAGVSTRAAGG
jgi:hypothetical protein